MNERRNVSSNIKNLSIELEAIRRERLLFMAIAVVFAFCFLKQYKYGLTWDLASYGVLAVGLSFMALSRLGTTKLLRKVQALEVFPTTECVTLLLKCMDYRIARMEAKNKLLTLFPSLSREVGQSVDSRLWRKLYKLAYTIPVEERHLAFDAAVLSGDKGAIPYLQRILRAEDIPPDTRVQMENRLTELNTLPD